MSDLTLGDALQFPNDRLLSPVLFTALLEHPESTALIRGAMERSNVAEVQAVLNALSITDRLSSNPAQPSVGSMDHRRAATKFTPIPTTEADEENLDTIKAHLGLKHTTHAMRAALMLYASLIRAGVFTPEPLEG